MKNFGFLIAWLFILSLVTGVFLDPTSPVRAQSAGEWTEPVNLSNSGATTNPSMVIDEAGAIHIFWLDQYDGYKYAKSTDGVDWTEPTTVSVPFYTDAEVEIKPVFLAAGDGTIHIFWKNDEGVLEYRRASSSSVGEPSTWTAAIRLADSIVHFDAAVDSQGAVHVGYITYLDTNTAPAGIYYRRLAGSVWSEATNIYSSKYFRSLAPENANIQLATSTEDETANVFIVWDDRSQRRIFLAKSLNGGESWDGVFQIRGPEDFSGVQMPFNVNLSVADDQVLLIWQAGIPGSDCTQYSQWSTDGGEQFGQPVKILDEFALCPQSGQFILSDTDFSVVLFNTVHDLSLMVWNGSRWSTQLIQSEISSFINPTTLDSIFLGCQNASAHNRMIYIVGCDTGPGGDIWFVSRPVGTTDEWFPPPSMWSQPTSVVTTDQRISSLVSTADQNNNIHNIWVQSPSQTGNEGKSTIQYAKWDGQKWSSPAKIISGLQPTPAQLTVSLGSLGKLLLAWVDGSSGDMLFTWANSDGASSASEWEKPVFIPSISGANSSPDIVSDASGRTVVAFAVPINEDRGIYIVESDDFGATWLKPYRIFDASAVNWHMVDQPDIALTGDGRLHILFGRYSLWGEQRRSMGLYSIHSSDGGVTWSQPGLVSEQPVLWSELSGDGGSNLHRIWLEQGISAMASIHQFSSDGGETWSTPTTLSTRSDRTVLNDFSIDLFGNLYFQQLTGPDEPTVLDQRWDEAGWQAREPKNLEIDTITLDPLSVVSSVSSDGHLVVSALVNLQDINGSLQSQIFSMTQLLELPESAATPNPALIAPAGSSLADPQENLEISETPTSPSPLAGIQNPQSFWLRNRNLIGLLLLGGVLAFLTLILLLAMRSKGKGKNKTG